MKNKKLIFLIILTLVLSEFLLGEQNPISSATIVKTSELQSDYLHYSLVNGQANHIMAKADNENLTIEYYVSPLKISGANDDLTKSLKSISLSKIPPCIKTEAPESAQKDADQDLHLCETPNPIYRKNQQTILIKLPQDSIGEKYFEFQERNGETLYELAIRYRISPDSILAINPGISIKLSKGQIIKIPVSKVRKDYITHTIKERTTINRLVKNYSLDIDEVLEINPYLTKRLQPGQLVKIPLPPLPNDDPAKSKESPEQEINLEDVVPHHLSGETFCGQLNSSDSHYNIALLIPFYLDEVEKDLSIEPDDNQSQQPPEPLKSFLFIQYYEGFLIAVDSMRNAGFNADIHVFNIENKVSQAKELLQNPLLKEMDLIIGPFFNSNFSIIADFAQANKIPIVNPLSRKTDFLKKNPYAIKVTPAQDHLYSLLASYITQHFHDASIFIARHSSLRDNEPINSLKSAIYQMTNREESAHSFQLHDINYLSDSLHIFEQKASKTGKNVVIAYSDNEVFILDIMRKLSLHSDTIDITLIGLPNWLEMENLDFKHLNNLNTHVVVPFYTNYNTEAVKNFVSRFREKYYNEPNDLAFKGYDTGLFFLSTLKKYGKHFFDCLPYQKMNLLQNNYIFQSTSSSGFENQSWKMLRFQESDCREIPLHSGSPKN